MASRDDYRRVGRDRGEQIETRRTFALIGGKRQIGSMGEPHHLKLGFAHDAAPAKAAAMRATSAPATSSFDCGGHDSTPSLVIRCTLLRSPPMIPVAAETSLATIQSQPLRLSLACALAMTFSVSAAKPITKRGRSALRCATAERMSGFSIRVRAGVAPFAFLIFWRPASATRRSATAAAN